MPFDEEDEPLNYKFRGDHDSLDADDAESSVGEVHSADFDLCPHCRKYIYADAERCPRCGKYLNDSTWKYKPRWFLLTVALAILCVMLFWVFLRGDAVRWR